MLAFTAFLFFVVELWIIDLLLNIQICIKLQTLKYNRKLSKAGVSLLKPEPRIRGAADGILNSVRTLPCHIIRYTHFMQNYSISSPHPCWGSMWSFCFSPAQMESCRLFFAPVFSSPIRLGGGWCTLVRLCCCRRPCGLCSCKARRSWWKR